MNASGDVVVSPRRLAYALSLSGLLLVAGVLMTVAAHPPAYRIDFPALGVIAVLVPAYLAGHQYSLDYEFRRESYSVTLVHLPLALGVQVIAPLLHLAVRVLAVLIYIALQRQSPVKALYNVGIVAFELGAAALAVSFVDATEGPARWFALYVGLLVGDLVGALVLGAIWRLLDLPINLRRTIGALVMAAPPVTLTFTAFAVIAIAALRAEPLTAPVMLGLIGGLALAYRSHRRTVSQQKASERLYEFMKELGPLDLVSNDTAPVLERIRLLLHAQQLDLATRHEGRWCHLVVTDQKLATRSGTEIGIASHEVAATGNAVLRRAGDSDSMATPLVGRTGLTGILTATQRMGAARSFDMRDLRLLETIGAELSTALERGNLLADLEKAATTDHLTGLSNLGSTTRRISELLSAHEDGVILAAAAVDSFRDVNDTLGHQVGDELLLEVTRRLLAAYPDAVVGRIGGGRFAVAVPAAMAGGDPEMFGLGLRTQVEGTVQIGAVGTHVKLSVGVARAPEHSSDAATLVRRAETAMHSAQLASGGPVLWEPAYEVQGTRRLAVVTALREALASGAIGVAYQPKVETVTGNVTGVEALARWTHPALGAITPNEFIPLAEASGLMGPLTATILRQSLTACKGWQRRAGQIGVAVNVSADTVLDPAFVTEVAAILASVGIDASRLTLELTEGVVVHDAELAVVRMEELRALGVKLSVDDFGTGYSSLTYLKGLPVDEVKIDKGFIDDLANDPADRAVVRAVVDIAHTLGLRVVAEGVEQSDQQGILRALGVDEVQGYLHARPMPALEVGAWLRRNESSVQL